MGPQKKSRFLRETFLDKILYFFNPPDPLFWPLLSEMSVRVGFEIQIDDSVSRLRIELL